MKQKFTMKKIMAGMAVALFSLPASAQLQLSAGANAEADTNTGATAGGDATASGGDAAEGPAEEAAPPPPPPMPVAEPVAASDTTGVAGYDGGFFIQTNDGNFKLKINGIAKARWDFIVDKYEDYNDDGEFDPGHITHSSFSQPYARVGLSGNFMTPKLGYMLMWDFSTSRPIYAYATWTFQPKKLVLHMGRFKRPFSRQYLTSSAKQMFVDGPVGQMGQGIDIGLQLSNNFTSATGLEWAVGVFNGNGSIVGVDNGDFSPVFVGRIGYNNGIKGYSDTDFEGGSLRFGVGLSLSTEFDHDDDDVTTHYLGLDGAIKVNGLALAAGIYIQALCGEGFWDAESNNTVNDYGVEVSGLSAFGTYIHAGYLINNKFEPIARYGLLNGYYEDNDLHQRLTAGFAVHIFPNHRFKWQNELSIDIQHANDPEDPDQEDSVAYQDLILTSQVQFYF